MYVNIVLNEQALVFIASLEIMSVTNPSNLHSCPHQLYELPPLRKKSDLKRWMLVLAAFRHTAAEVLT